ncbi:MAG: FAD-dependent oxidoreductase [Clostridia bacterium]|nr:FAD-dependent oxidoreductase [Clostridia bacterium]
MKQYELIVVGGGLTGVAAAISAARNGVKTLLAERTGWLGGALSNNLVFPFMPWWTVMPDGSTKDLSDGIFTEMLQRANQYGTPQKRIAFDPEYFKLILDEMVKEAGVDVLFHANLCDVKTEDRKIQSLTFAVKGGFLDLDAKYFIDATGDGDLFAFAGCEYQLGRDSDNLCQPMTTCFRLYNVDVEKFRKEKPEMQKLYKEYQAQGKITNPRENLLIMDYFGPGAVHFNSTRVTHRNPTDPFDLSEGEAVARKQVFEIVSMLRGNFESCKDAKIMSIAPEIGVRESRKLRGVHLLTEQELKDCTVFEDSIALGNYDIDIHNPAGSGTSHYYFKDGTYYTIPYRSLLPKEFDNLLVAGRCLSATHEAQASVRIMPICATMGQAAGTAIGVMKKTNTNAHEVDVKEIQRILEEAGAAIR